MAKTTKKTAKAKGSTPKKAPKESKIPVVESKVEESTATVKAAETQPAAAEPAPAKPDKKNQKEKVASAIAAKFGEVRAAVQALQGNQIKAPRPLRFALETLDMAERAAERALKHN